MPSRAPLRILLAVLLGGIGASAGAEGPRPDVLLITVDTLRPDALGWIGGTNETPAIDGLAASGFRFPRAIAPAPLTLPSHVSMMTGLTPRRHGVRDNGRYFPPTGPETLAERLRAAGYATAAFVSGFPLAATFGLDRGFDRYDDRFEAPTSGGLERSALATVSAAVEWAARTAAPRFIWVHFYDPHDPYVGASGNSAAALRAAYDGEVREVDTAIARLTAALPGNVAPRLTVFAADHGESLGEHGESTHGLFVYQSTVAVPLVFSWPGRIAPGGSTRRARIVDLAPTVLELLGLSPWSGRDGVSWASAFAGRAPDPPPAWVESRRPWHSYGWAPLEAVIDGGWKLVVAPRPELYDLDADPNEATNLYDRERRVAHRLAALRRELAPAAEAEASDDPGTLSRLRALGYIGGGSNREGEPPPGLSDPKDRIESWNRLGRGEAALERGEIAAALAEFEAVLAQEPDNPFALARSASALFGQGRLREAEARLRRALRGAPEQSEIRRLLIEILQREQRFAEAADQWMELARRRPRDAASWRGLGAALGLTGRPADALRAFETLVELLPRSVEARARLAFAAVSAGERERAVTELEAAAALSEPGAFPHSAALGVLLDDLGRSQEAIPWLERCLPAEPEYGEARLRLARHHAAAGRRVAARIELERALVATPALAERAGADPLLAGLR